MKASDADILIVPGYTNAGPDHWQSRWERGIKTARRVEQAEWSKPVREDWVARVVEESASATRPIVFVAHSLGVPTVLHALPDITMPVAGLFLVAPPDVADPTLKPKHLLTFGPYPDRRLEVPALVIASRNDPFCALETAIGHAETWGAGFKDAGEAGHINTESGHGPWPEGSLTFAKFMAALQTARPH